MAAVGAVVEDGVENVAASAGQANEGALCFLALGSLRGEEERAFESRLPGAGGVLASDRGAGAAGDGDDAGVGGEVGGAGEVRGVADLEEPAALTLMPGIEVRASAREGASRIPHQFPLQENGIQAVRRLL